MTDPEAQLREYAARLADGVQAALPGWVIGQVERVATAWSGTISDPVRRAAEQAADEAGRIVGPQVRRLLELDLDEQRTTPLALVRAAVSYPTAVLRQAGVPPVTRDPFAEKAFPEDIYDLSPASFADLDPELLDAGLAWGAAKAFVHKRRHTSRPSGASE